MTNHQPVIIGVAQAKQRLDDVSKALEPIQMMTRVVNDALVDAAATEHAHRIDTIAVVSGAWSYPDPARLIADELGCPNGRTIRSAMGGNSPQSLVNELAARIQDGRSGAALIVGAETIWSRRRKRLQNLPTTTIRQEPTEPDEHFQHDVAMGIEAEADVGLTQPIEFYPIFETALRHHSGRSVSEHTEHLGRLWESFNTVARNNPHAWSRQALDAKAIVTASPENRMVGYPYTKAMNSNWDLDQAAAILMVSNDVADEIGSDQTRRVYPLAGADAHDTLAVSHRYELYESPAIREVARAIFDMAGITANDVDIVDLYSCFPSAVQVAAAEIGFTFDRTLTITGGLTFAGGPLNNYVTHSISTMVERLRTQPGAVGLVSANGGYLTKHAIGLYSTEPLAQGFQRRDVQDRVDDYPTRRLDALYEGEATLEGYTVMHTAEGPIRALAALRTPQGARTWAFSTDPSIWQVLMSEDAVGVLCHVGNGRQFSLARE